MDDPIITNQIPTQTQPEAPQMPAQVQAVSSLSTAAIIMQKLRSPWAGIAAIIAIFLIGSLIVAGTKSTTPTPLVPTPTPTTIPTPTPQRTPSAIASQSAFQALDASVQSLANDLNGLSIRDPSLSPPVLDLPLGFSNN